MSNNLFTSDDKQLIALGFAIGLLIGGWVVGFVINSDYKIKAIKYEAAYYHPETGKFTWKGQEIGE